MVDGLLLTKLPGIRTNSEARVRRKVTSYNSTRNTNEDSKIKTNTTNATNHYDMTIRVRARTAALWDTRPPNVLNALAAARRRRSRRGSTSPRTTYTPILPLTGRCAEKIDAAVYAYTRASSCNDENDEKGDCSMGVSYRIATPR